MPITCSCCILRQPEDFASPCPDCQRAPQPALMAIAGRSQKE
ncbi:hypothetical protein [Synechococcus elongatus]|uniref:Uncharacterized protein n=1 Tax=Synechococcus elongatus PCC 11802 TaxID=2283154 RepID=A0AAT9JQX5_SYNEL|nr:hypothetical protein [Synechococcus elongatus]